MKKAQFLERNLEFGDVGFCGGRKTREPGEKPSELGENQQQTQSTYGTGPGAHFLKASETFRARKAIAKSRTLLIL